MFNVLFDIQHKIFHHHFFQKHKEFLCLINPHYDCKHYCMNQEQLKEYNELQIEEIKKLMLEENISNIEDAVKAWAGSEKSIEFRNTYHFKKWVSLF